MWGTVISKDRTQSSRTNADASVLYWYRLFIVYIINNISRLYCVYELTPSLPNNLKTEIKRNSLLQYIGKKY